MKIYHVTRTDEVGYDEYDSWIIAANSADEAGAFSKYSTIVIQPIGEAYPEMKAGIILGSFNAG